MKGRDRRSDRGPVPARELAGAGEPEPARQEGPEGKGPHGKGPPPAILELRFEAEGEEWLARPAGAGCYGTGRRGTARLLAVHFYRATAADEPVREALIPAGAFAVLPVEELVEVWARATPIEPA